MRGGLTREEFIDGARDKLYDAARKHDPKLGGKFSSYLDRTLRNYALVIKNKVQPFTFESLNEPAYADGTGEKGHLLRDKKTPLPDEQVDRKRLRGILVRAIDDAVKDEDPRYRKIIMGLYSIDGYKKGNQRELAEEYGLSPWSVSDAHTRILKKMKKGPYGPKLKEYFEQRKS